MSHRYDREQTEAIKAVVHAGRLCRAVRAEVNPGVLDKRDRSPVTVADFGSQAIIGRSLEAGFPADPIIAEEDSAQLQEPKNAPLLAQVVHHVRSILHDQGCDLSPDQVCGWIDRGRNRKYCDRFWTLDPIDGTKGFLRNEQYAIALALIVQGKVVVAALACPNLAVEAASVSTGTGVGVVFTAATGQGALAMPMDDDPAGGSWRALCVSAGKTPPRAGFANPWRLVTAIRETRLQSLPNWESRRLLFVWTARPSTGSLPEARLRSTCACRLRPTIVRRSGITRPAP